MLSFAILTFGFVAIYGTAVPMAADNSVMDGKPSYRALERQLERTVTQLMNLATSEHLLRGQIEGMQQESNMLSLELSRANARTANKARELGYALKHMHDIGKELYYYKNQANQANQALR